MITCLSCGKTTPVERYLSCIQNLKYSHGKFHCLFLLQFLTYSCCFLFSVDSLPENPYLRPAANTEEEVKFTCHNITWYLSYLSTCHLVLVILPLVTYTCQCHTFHTSCHLLRAGEVHLSTYFLSHL